MASRSQFPTVRLRRLRQDPAIRALLRSTDLSPPNMIAPLFVRPGKGERRPIEAMPGQFQLSVDTLVEEARKIHALRLGGVILFGIPPKKDATGSDALSDDGIVQQGVRAIRKAVPDLLVATDLCFCEFTDHGHCGVVHENRGRVDVDNDATLELLGKQAVSHAQAGSSLIAPSGMMDGMVGAIRQSLDEAGFAHLPIMSYAVKYASAFYGPFREAVESAPGFGDRRAYQMDPAVSSGQALREAALDLEEGADILMVKPALAYLDILHFLRDKFPEAPLAAYNVSGEYSMVKAAAERGWINEKETVLESLIAMRRAGANILLTYWAQDVARWLST